MLANEQAAVCQYNKELVDCFVSQMEVVIAFFRKHNYITNDQQLHIDSQSPLNKPQCVINYLLQADDGWKALNDFLCLHQRATLSENLKQARSNPSKRLASFTATDAKLWNVPLQMQQFVGRALLLEELAKRLDCMTSSESTSKHSTRRVTCAGLGGVGKSSLALEFAYKNLNIYSNIFWISATSKEIIEARFMELGEELGFSASEEKRSWKDAFSWLHTSSNWLMIFDDAQDYASINEYIPRINGDVLITSRYSIWPHQVLNVDVFTKEEALSCINAFLPTADENAATVLAHELENFPLALAQACAYVVQRHISIDAYLKKLRRSRADMLASKILPHDCNSKPVYYTWDITVEQIGKECAFTVALLEFCSLLEGHSIPDCLLDNFAKNHSQSTEVYEESRGLLCNYLLVTVVEQNAPLPCISVHPLVQTITAAKLTAEKCFDYCINAYACIQQLWPDKYDKEYGKWLSTLFPQLLKCLERVQLDVELPLQVKLPVQQLTNMDNETTTANKTIFLTVAQLINTATTHAAVAYQYFGDYHNAKLLFEKTLLVATNMYEAQHMQIATSLANLASASSKLGDYKQAKALIERALKITELHYGSV